MSAEPLTDLDKVRAPRFPNRSQWLASVRGEGMPATHQIPVVPTQWVLDFDYPRNPIPLNGSHGKWQTHWRKTQNVRTVAARFAQLAGIPALGRCRAQLTWYVLTKTHRDVENLAYTLKSMCDGLVTAGVVPDDTPDLMDKPMPRIIRVDRMKHGSAWMELVVTRWAGLEVEATDG